MLRPTASRLVLIAGGAHDRAVAGEDAAADPLWTRLRQEAREAYARAGRTCRPKVKRAAGRRHVDRRGLQ